MTTAPQTAGLTPQQLGELEQHIAQLPIDHKRVKGSSMLTGRITSAGAITAGTGFTVTHDGTGTYTVTFTAPFDAAPTVVGSGVSSSNDFFTITAVSATAFSVLMQGGAGTPGDAAFHFIAATTI